MYDDKELYELAEKVGQHLKSSGRKLTIAESCTGGWIAKAITDVPGSSQWFEFGFSVYADIAKRDLLGIDITTLEAEGSVSQPIVTEMAEGALGDIGIKIRPMTKDCICMTTKSFMSSLKRLVSI